MRFAISITDMTAADLIAVSTFVASMGGTPVDRTIAELAASTGAGIPAPAHVQNPAPAAPPLTYPSPGQPWSPTMPAPPLGAQPPAPAAPGSTAAQGVPAFDSRGLPHNPAFYADSKRQNADGSWAKRKGCDKAACEAWEASTPRGAPSVPQPAATPQPAAPGNSPAATVSPGNPSAADINAKFAPGLPPQGVAPAPNGADPFAAPVAGAQPAAPSTPAAPPAPPAPAAPVAPVEVTYAQWHQMYTSLMVSGKITPEKYAEIAGRHGGADDVMRFMNDAGARAASYQEFQALAAA